MLEGVLARLYALEAKGGDLADKGHMLRAAEYCGRAEEAARELGEDNLVSAFMQAQQASAISSHVLYAATVKAAKPHDLAPHCASCIALLSSSMAAMERRRAAGTLLEDKCSAAEEAWYAGRLRCNQPHLNATSLAVLVGYGLYLSVARSALYVLANAFFFEAECSYTQFHAFTHHVVSAVDMLQLQLGRCGVNFTTEALLMQAFRDLVPLFSRNSLDARLVQQLTQAWERLQCSGALQSESFERGVHRYVSEQLTHKAAVAKSAAAPGLRCCALASCGTKEAHPDHFKRCAACKAVAYCCRDHQVADWPAHKAACKAARKAAAAKDEAGPSA